MKNKTRTFIYYFIIIQPFLDFSIFYNGKLADELPFTLPTIIRIIAITAIAIMFFKTKGNWQQLVKNKWLLAYIALLLAYSALHLLSARSFKSVSPDSYGYSAAGELFYLIRLFLPLLLIYFTCHCDFNQQLFRKAILTISFLFSAVIVVSNFLAISLRSYGDGTISKNIFFWYDKSIGYSHLASKGFFNFANMVAAVLLMLLPLVLYYLNTSFNFKTVIITILHALAMIMLGTKVALFGLILGLIVSGIAILIHAFLLKNLHLNKKALACMCLFLLGSILLTPISPAVQRYQYEQYLAQHSNHNTRRLNAELKAGLKSRSGTAKKQFALSFITQHYQDYALNERFITKSYPYQRDPYFWIDIMNLPGAMRLQNRLLEQKMLDRVLQTNNSYQAKLLGMGYMRQTHIFNLERDFVSQNYSLGISGSILFLVSYLLILLWAIIFWFKKKAFRSFLHSSLILAVGYLLLAAFSSGNVIDFPTANLILAFSEGFLLSRIIKSKKESSHS